MTTTQKMTAVPADGLTDFPGHVPDRSEIDGEVTLVDVGEFLSTLEPRTVQRTGPGEWKSTRRTRAGEPTSQQQLTRLLDEADEQEREKRAGIKRTP